MRCVAIGETVVETFRLRLRARAPARKGAEVAGLADAADSKSVACLGVFLFCIFHFALCIGPFHI
jgi:hypothetical protein